MDKSASERAQNTTTKRLSKSDKLPSMPFYFGDWKKDLGIQSLDFFDRGVWLEILGMMWDSEERGVLVLNGRPMTVDQISRALGLLKQNLEECLTRLSDAGVYSVRSDGAIYSRKMVRNEEIRLERIKAGKSGGNPTLLKQNSSKTKKEDKQIHVYVNENETVNEDLKKEERPSILTPEAESALDLWAEYLVKGSMRPLDAISRDALALSYAGRPNELVRDIRGSISRRWKQIYACPPEEPKQSFGKPKFNTTDQIEKIMNFEIKEIGVARK